MREDDIDAGNELKKGTDALLIGSLGFKTDLQNLLVACLQLSQTAAHLSRIDEYHSGLPACCYLVAVTGLSHN